jgi:NAD(P)H dehydrogenase (quinone)
VLQVAETLPAEVLAKMHAPPKDANVRTITDPQELKQYDGILFGIPTRFGMMPAQMKAFVDSTGGLWMEGALVGKTGGVFFSTATQGGGQETTALTAITQFTHHGMIYVPIGYSDPSIMSMDEVHGGSPYGAGTFAGPKGDRQPSALELGVAQHQGKHFGTITSALKAGRAALAATK